MCHDQNLEQKCMADPPWLVLSLRIVSVEIGDSSRIKEGDCDWHIDRESRIVEVCWDAEWMGESRDVGRRWQSRGK